MNSNSSFARQSKRYIDFREGCETKQKFMLINFDKSGKTEEWNVDKVETPTTRRDKRENRRRIIKRRPRVRIS